MLQTSFAEFPFYALGCIRARKCKGLVLRASSKRPILVSDRALSHARALRGSLASAYDASLFQSVRVEAKNPAPRRWVPKGRVEPAAQPATAK